MTHLLEKVDEYFISTLYLTISPWIVRVELLAKNLIFGEEGREGVINKMSALVTSDF